MKGLRFNIYVVLLWLLAAFVCGCDQHRAIREKLERAESLMDSRPDSALVVLDSLTLSYPTLDSDRDRALYGMLYTQALDKNHLDPKNDSLISFAVDYYDRKKDIPRQIISTYYRGRVLYHKEQFPQALVCFYKAKGLAENDSSFFWAGMACRGIADIHYNTYNPTEQLIYANKEYEYLKKSGKQPYLNYALHDLGRALSINGKTDEVLTVSSQLLDSAKVADDLYLNYDALHLKAGILLYDDRYDEAYPILSEICESGYADTTDSLDLCLTLVHKGAENTALKLINYISPSDSLMKSMIRYEAYKKMGLYPLALTELEESNYVTNDILRSAMKQDLTTALAEYFEFDKKLNNAKLKASRIKIWLIVTVSLLILSIWFYITNSIRRRQKQEIATKVLFAEQLQEALEQSRNENSASFQIIKTLLASKYELFEELSEILIRYNDTKIARRKIADRVTELIDSLSIKGDKIKELEKQVNELYNNLYSDFKNDLPGLKEADYLLYLFSVLSLSSTSISLLLKEDKVDAVYNRKRRLKDKIKQLEAPKRDRYMSYLS
ncbi:MAG: hypothetical protein K2H47_07100 [Muribaculaceae bacterium]|nr:hypothetical protein [Muribaculaceae bacterium]